MWLLGGRLCWLHLSVPFLWSHIRPGRFRAETMNPEVVLGGVLFVSAYCLILFLLSLLSPRNHTTRPRVLLTPLFDLRPEVSCALLGSVVPPGRFPTGSDDCA